MNSQIHLIASSAELHPGLQGEADHRIANSLASLSALVRMAARRGKFDDPRRILLETADRIECVAALHRQVAHSASGAVWPRPFLEDICGRLRAAVTDNNLTLKMRFRDEQALEGGIVQNLGLMLLELLSNSIKYAHPAGTHLTVKVNVAQTRSSLLFEYEDDGVGFPENFDRDNDGNMGMRYLAVLSQKLNGVPEWSSSELGVRLSLRIPVAPAIPAERYADALAVAAQGA